MALRADVITPIDAGTVSVLLPLTIDAGAGDQYHAHVDGDLAAYTSESDIRYYSFFTGDDAGIPHVPGFPDWLSDVSNGKIAFTRTLSDSGWDIYVYDTTSQALTAIAPSPSTHHRIWPSIGGTTVAFLDLGPWGTPDLPQILVADLADPSTAIRVTDTAQYEGYNSGVGVSPGGDVLVWDSCDFAAGDQTTCEIYKAVRSGASWVTSRVTTNTFADEYPRTDGAVISWISTRDGEQDVYWQDVAGGEEHRLAIPGEQRLWPTVAGGVIAIESAAVGENAADIYLYQIASNRLFRITSTPDDEELSDIAMLTDGRFRLVWNTASNGRDVYGATIELPPVTGGNYSFAGFLHPVDAAPTVNVMKAGAAVAVKFSLGGYRGVNIFAPGYPKSAPMNCSYSAVTAAIEETTTAGASTLQYDATADVYTYVWKTDKGWAGTCRQLLINFDDSSTQYANFKFK